MAGRPQRIDVRQLRPGLYVSLGERWLDHSFLFNSFRLSSDAQVAKVRALGLTHVDWWPERSTTTPLPLPDETAPPPAAPPATAAPASAESDDDAGERAARIERMARRRASLARCERAYRHSVDTVRTLMAELFVSPGEAGAKADGLVAGVVDELLVERDVIVTLMHDGPTDAGARYHALNVMILSLLLGRALGLDAARMRTLGLGALLHDVGRIQVPASVLRIDASRRNRHEEAAWRLHAEHGATLCAQLGVGSAEVLDVVRHHHERLDGSGFPDGLAGERIGLPTRIVALANRYDGLCHPVDARTAMTPSEALAHLWRNESAGFDRELLQRFVKCLGVWPPGTIVQLTNGAIGLVTAVDPTRLLAPTVLVADLSVPRAEALIVDLREADGVEVQRALRPSELDPEVLAYLSPRMRSNWYFGSEAPR